MKLLLPQLLLPQLLPRLPLHQLQKSSQAFQALHKPASFGAGFLFGKADL
jgi:hypothetical protein